MNEGSNVLIISSSEADFELFSVVLDESGFSKGFGFIRFGNEQEQQTALTSMMGVSGLGGKPLKASQDNN